MLPLQQAKEIRYSVLEYLKATFAFKNREVQEAFNHFITDPGDGLFKGPYISLKLPFITGKEDEIPLEIKPQFLPFDHQLKSFKRLSTANDIEPKPTLITTGTSSGKTESFLFPILDYCYKHKDRKGIKVIILYPMNALASDQAKRIAELIFKDDRLKDSITAGLFIGEGRNKNKYPKEMGAENIIENRDAILDSPPDILLTNFKMLDYGLMKSSYHRLWAFNLEEPTLLKFLVLDELHTYDGAQGTDVANLIRRLKLKLQVKEKQLCPIGTSATIASGDEAIANLTSYAQKIFGEEFSAHSILTENRIPLEDFIAKSDEQLETYIPRVAGLRDNKMSKQESYQDYIKRQKRLWQISEHSNAIKLAEDLKTLKVFKDLLFVTSKGITSLDKIVDQLCEINNDFKKIATTKDEKFNPAEEIIQSLLALVAEAKIEVSNREQPFLYLQVQIWIRELSGVLRTFSDTPLFTWRDKVEKKKEGVALPPYFCRECGASGWLGVKHDNKNRFEQDALDVYQHYFDSDKNLYFINTLNNVGVEEYQATDALQKPVSIYDLTFSDRKTEDDLDVIAYRKVVNNKARHVCPECNTEDTVSIIGTRVATLSSLTVSQVLSSDLDSRTEKYRKVLAFTNSVQDAAHQAGFIEARNYRFTFRSSLQKVINEINVPVDLPTLQNKFIEYWKTRSDETNQNDEEAYYYRFLPNDYLRKVDLNKDFRDKFTRRFTLAFKQEFDERMRWEITSEFAYNAQIGRTLEKSAASAVAFDIANIERAFEEMKGWLDLNQLHMLEKNAFVSYVIGVLHRMRIRGAVDHEYLSKFRDNNGNSAWLLNWDKDTRHFLNKRFHSQSRYPKLLATTQVPGKTALDTTFSKSKNWYAAYFNKSFNLIHYQDIINDFYKELFEVLTNVGLLNSKGDTIINYCIDPATITVSNKVVQLKCDKCESILSVAESQSVPNNIKCLDYRCEGTYNTPVESQLNYYQLIYNRDRSPRIYATEHTGILERNDREQKEFDFKNRPKFNSLNALVATSTLEMGIDIGSLNTVINNSIPPTTSNFLQRIGRAGRSSGSAFITNFALSKSHDQYYYTEPEEMMNGEVSTPGCFLEARDILFRHFLAFCIDSWTSIDPLGNTIPGTIMMLRLLTTDINSPTFPINRIVHFISKNKNALFVRFSNCYKKDLERQEVLQELKAALNNESITQRLVLEFKRLKEELQQIIKLKRDIDNYIKEKKLGKDDDERIALEAEKRALGGLKRLIDKRLVVEHLTNAGLLPNYAFPETGVTLNAWIRSDKAKGSDAEPKDKQFEITRSASSAIKELAPDNYFYSQGYRLEVSGINTYDWKDNSVLVEKRFCSNCDNLDDAPTADGERCKKCGDESWGSARNKHKFVKLITVKSVNTKEESTLDDSSDERDAERYARSVHFKFDHDNFLGAWGMTEIPFGIEFVKGVEITELNLGSAQVTNSDVIKINDIESIPNHGFVTCKYCGKSTSKPHNIQKKNFKFHYGYCKHKDRQYTGVADDVFEQVYLFRTLETEAIKILLPVQEFESEATVQMFKAGIELALKKYFKGNPQHLVIDKYREYNFENTRFDQYLVMYDIIPGGTGYLQKLFDTKQFSSLLNLAYESIRDCSCKDHGKDGCYRCIYSYQNQYLRDDLSRKRAEELFFRILSKSKDWEQMNSGLGSLSRDGQIEESELELRFIKSLKMAANSLMKGKLSIDTFFENGTQCYTLKVTNESNAYYYTIRPQFELNSIHNVDLTTRPDFYLSLTSIEKNGQIVGDDSLLQSFKKVAIYLDGYIYHATKQNLRFYDDLKKRLSIKNSRDKISWTLTWKDLDLFDKEEKDLFVISTSQNKQLSNVLRSVPGWKNFSSQLLDCKNSMERLLWILTEGVEQARLGKIGLYLSNFQERFGFPSFSDVEPFLNFLKKIPMHEVVVEKSKGDFYIFSNIRQETEFDETRIFIKMKDLQVKSAIKINENYRDDLNKHHWEAFWQIYNLIQESIYEQTTVKNEEVYNYFDEDLHPILDELIRYKVPFNGEGSFILEDDGLAAEAALGFINRKKIIRPLSEGDKKVFEKAGYTEIKPEDFNITEVL